MKKTIFTIFSIALGLAFGLAVCEGVLRWRGIEPWTVFGVDSGEPTFHENDPILGWRLKPGQYKIRPYSDGAEPIRLTVLPEGRRVTSGDGADRRAKSKIITAGCSYTFGWAVSDEETYPWKLQGRWKESREVVNCGTGGYSAYQTLLLLEKLLPEIKPEGVIYGLTDFQEVRNTAPASWMCILARFSKRGHVDVPFVSIDMKGNLCRHKPGRYEPWPGADIFASINKFQWCFQNIWTLDRRLQKEEATRRLLVEMSRLCGNYGARFMVALLYVDKEEKRAEYMSFLSSQGVKMLDVAVRLTPDKIVVNEGHPNGKAHSIWADTIGHEWDKNND